ncbi:yjeF C-terminal region, hydroxyethylthiazole kinase-related/yjeF N-terminal region [Roseateles sp. YR242]|uniref:NAD(P)H-hydrate dehydratase n=1 Tax=Roseateles sp. YR242 TaxID=1855305 RepID=UPI0008B7D103|nr:NAD(P)H-hydrate dehydratase [Roseateles sp. YR242]SEL56136.1 yjeF C-terminal region, hydroxyethylthiazole kinase-related/yjeF N-terminal region [Roseateles sp. YR242]
MHALLPTTTADWPLHDTAASRALEQAALAGHPPHTLIERAGEATARLALALWPHGRSVVVLAGPGNNGGDALIAGRCLAARGWQVRVHRIGPPPQAGSDAAYALRRAIDAGLVVHEGLPDTAVLAGRIDLWIDGLLGLGTRRAPEGGIAAAIRIANQHPAPTLAIDLPSGLNADTGQALGPDVTDADHTLTLLSIKPGLFTGEGRAFSGRIWFDDLATATATATAPASAPAPMPAAGAGAAATAILAGTDHIACWHRHHPRGATSHKGRQGDVVVLGGAPGMRGAAWLAASAALGAGAGRVYAALLEDDGQPWPARPELMHWPADRWVQPHGWRDAVVVCGCGGGGALLPWLDAVLHEAQQLVLDADGLNLVAAHEGLARRLAARRARGLHSLLTPHPLEAARLLQYSGVADIQANRLGAAQALADKFQAAVVLKGSGSILASPGQRPSINSSGSAALATAGTGDVLAGWAGGLWAQAPDASPHEVGLTAVVWHGASAAHHGGPLRAADLIEAMVARHPIS